jgi:hypothetical protein
MLNHHFVMEHTPSQRKITSGFPNGVRIGYVRTNADHVTSCYEEYYAFARSSGFAWNRPTLSQLVTVSNLGFQAVSLTRKGDDPV